MMFEVVYRLVDFVAAYKNLRLGGRPRRRNA